MDQLGGELERALAYHNARPPFLLRRTDQLLTRLFFVEARELCITVPQLQALWLITTAPGADQITLARRLGADRSTTTLLIDGLAQRGLADRAVGQDRRKRLIQPGPNTGAVLEPALKALHAANRALLSPLSREDQDRLVVVLETLAARPDSPAPALEPLMTNGLCNLYRSPGFLIGRLGQIARAAYFQGVDRPDFAVGQYVGLYLVCAFKSLDQTTLGRALGADRPSVAMIVRALERRGLIARTTDAADGRRRLLSCLPEGEEVLAETRPRIEAADDDLFGPPGAPLRSELVDLLTRVVKAHGAFVGPGG